MTSAYGTLSAAGVKRICLPAAVAGLRSVG